MQNNRLTCRAARNSSRGGFTLVELLVVIGIIAILAGVALGPITRGIKQAQENATLQVAHQLGALEFAYSNDFNQVYPYGAKSETIANLMLNGGYATDASIFYVANTPLAVKGTPPTTAGNPWVLGSANVNWDFMINSTGTSGLTSNASDATPLVELTGATVSMAISGPISATLATNSTAFGADGIAVYYKGNNAKFLKGVLSGASSGTIATYLDSSYADSAAASYGLVKP